MNIEPSRSLPGNLRSELGKVDSYVHNLNNINRESHRQKIRAVLDLSVNELEKVKKILEEKKLASQEELALVDLSKNLILHFKLVADINLSKDVNQKKMGELQMWLEKMYWDLYNQLMEIFSILEPAIKKMKLSYN